LAGALGGVIATGQAGVVLATGLVEIALLLVICTSAKSLAPVLSVTVSRNVKLPVAGAATLAIA